MAFIRVQIWDNNSWYTFPINPIEIDLQDSDEYKNIDTIDGETTQQKPFFDNRIRKMKWENLPQKDPYLSMVIKLKTFKGVITNMILNRLNFDDTTPVQVKILNVKTEISSNASAASPYKMVWSSVELEYVLMRV
jgi:hypothetical protein